MKYNVYNINNCDFVGILEFESCKETMDVLDLEQVIILEKFEPLLEMYNKEIYDNRYNNGSWFIFVNSITLKPALEISYYEFNDELAILVDIPEHDTRAIFFENLYDNYVNKIKYHDGDKYCHHDRDKDEEIDCSNIECGECKYFYSDMKDDNNVIYVDFK